MQITAQAAELKVAKKKFFTQVKVQIKSRTVEIVFV